MNPMTVRVKADFAPHSERDMLDEIVTAIRHKQVMTVNYHPGMRDIEPHAIGYGREGQLLLRAFQTSGASTSGEPINWKLFRLDRLSGRAMTRGPFLGPRPGYRRGDPAMTLGIIAEL